MIAKNKPPFNLKTYKARKVVPGLKSLGKAMVLLLCVFLLTTGWGCEDIPLNGPGGGGTGGGNSSSYDIKSKTVAAGETWEVTETTTIGSLVIEEGAEVVAAEGAVLTLIAGDLEQHGATTITGTDSQIYMQSLEAGTYKDVSIEVTDFIDFAGSWAWQGATENAPYRTALLITADGIVDNMSATGAISAGKYNESGASNVMIDGLAGDFSGIIVDDAEYSITNTTIAMGDTSVDGSDTNDFAGLGAAVMVSGENAKLTVKNSSIETTGVGKLPIFIDNGGSLLMKKSSLNAMGGTLYDGYMSTADQSIMVAPPWVLGLDMTVANARASNLMGDYSLAAYVDCDVDAYGWAGLSTDSGSYMHLVAVNTKIDVKNSGYGTYVIGSCTQDFYGTTINAGTIGIILTGGVVNMGPHTAKTKYSFGKIESDDTSWGTEGDAVFSGVTSSAKKTVNSSIKADLFGFMAHNSSEVNLEPGTTIKSGNAVFLVKAGDQEFNVDGATLKSDNGVILQMFDNDDSATGVDPSVEWGLDDLFYGHTYGTHMPTFNETFSEDDGYSDEFGDASSYSTANTCALNLENGDYKGDVWNSTGYIADGSALTVTIASDATLTGLISAGAYMHDQKTIEVGDGDWSQAEYLGQVSNKVSYSGVNTVAVVNNGTWNITEDGIISDYSGDGTVSGGTVEYDDTNDYWIVTAE